MVIVQKCFSASATRFFNMDTTTLHQLLLRKTVALSLRFLLQKLKRPSSRKAALERNLLTISNEVRSLAKEELRMRPERGQKEIGH